MVKIWVSMMLAASAITLVGSACGGGDDDDHGDNQAVCDEGCDIVVGYCATLITRTDCLTQCAQLVGTLSQEEIDAHLACLRAAQDCLETQACQPPP